MAGKQTELTIVIPALGEARRIGATLDELAGFLRSSNFVTNVEVLVVAADAGDDTAKIAESKAGLFMRLRVLRPGPRLGKGRDVQFGVMHAKGSFVVFMDADLATPLWHLQEFYQACQQADVVIGTRNLLTYRHNLLYGVFAYMGNALYRITGGVQVEDTQCGFKMFTATAAQTCFGKLTILDWGFDMELLAIARANKLRLKAIRIDDWQHVAGSTHHENVLQILWRTVRQHVCIMMGSVFHTYK